MLITLIIILGIIGGIGYLIYSQYKKYQEKKRAEEEARNWNIFRGNTKPKEAKTGSGGAFNLFYDEETKSDPYSSRNHGTAHTKDASGQSFG